MSYFEAFILAIVEGVTEFLPISSTGHLVLASDLMRLTQTEFVKSFEIFIQLGAILAVVFIYFKTLLGNMRIWKNLLIAFLPSAVSGLIFYKLIKEFLLGNTLVILVSLFVGGIALIFLELIYRNKKPQLMGIEELSAKKAFFIGLFQSVAMIPGVSRAAATIFGGLFLGLSRKAAVEFSFLLAVPTMFAASSLDLAKSGFHFTGGEFSLLVLGFLGSFIVAYFVVKYFLRYIEHHNFIPFGIYRIIVAFFFWFFIVR